MKTPTFKKYKDEPEVPGFQFAYRGCDCEVSMEESLGGWSMVYYSIFTHADPEDETSRAYEVDSGFFDCEIDLFEAAKDLQGTVDAYHEAGGTPEAWGW
jgi:hypothetical protein